MGTIPVVVKISEIDGKPISTAAFLGSALFLSAEEGLTLKTSRVVKAAISGSVFTITTMNSTYEFQLLGENLQFFNDQLHKKQVEMGFTLTEGV